MYEFARRPKWIVSHVLVVLGIVAMVGMGLWQLDRLDQRRSRNDEISARLVEPVVDITELVTADNDHDVGQDVRWRRATSSGIYQADDEVLILGRSLNGSPGYWAMTPLLMNDGSAVAVNRGWVPFTPGPGEPRPASEPPDGHVDVEGIVRQTVVAEGLQSDDPSEGVLDALARPDLARLEQQLGYPLLPVYLQLVQQVPPGQQLPVPVPPPALGEGPHLSYAMQWLVFTIIAVVGYPLVLRRVAHSQGREGRHSDIPVDYL